MSSVTLTFEAKDDEPGLLVEDPIEGRTVAFDTPATVDPEPLDGDGFLFPTDAACSIETAGLHLDTMVSVYVRTPSGEMVDRIRSHQHRELPRGTYHLEFSGTVKIYLRVDGAITYDAGADRLDISFDGTRRVDVGARSYHETPAATITTTTDPSDVMTALSTLSSSLKTTRPEMSYPTLRGHPPLLSIGEELSIPDGIEPTRTGITIEVPPELRMIYPVASLAYYLGADVREGEPPRIVTDDGFTFPLVTERWFEDEVARVLKQVLLLDSVVRTEGFYADDLYERRLVEPLLESDLGDLYDLPLRRRLEEYLQVDFGDVRSAVPRWVMTAYVPPTGDGAEVLPYLVNELAIIRNPRGTRIDAAEARSDLGVPNGTAHTFLNDGNRVRLLVRPELFDESVEHVWFGDHVPIGATKGVKAAFEQKVNRKPGGSGLNVAVVSNDPGLVQEPDVLEEAYRGRTDLDYDIDTYVGATTAELRSILESDYDFFHYIGETSPTGIHGTDGTIDVRKVDDIAVEAFFVDANHSFEEALGLVANGAVGGIGTVGTVSREDAIEIGRAIARLLNVGFSIRGALDLVREQIDIGEQYVIVGDGSVDIAQPDSTIPIVVDIEDRGEDAYGVAIDAYPAGVFRVGSRFTPHLQGVELDFLSPGMMGTRYTLSESSLKEHLGMYYAPLRINGSLYWNNTLRSNSIPPK
ncbi:MAG: hypothetical protein ABEJ76_03790 [Halanaeroarchaeum sp.]